MVSKRAKNGWKVESNGSKVEKMDQKGQQIDQKLTFSTFKYAEN